VVCCVTQQVCLRLQSYYNFLIVRYSKEHKVSEKVRLLAPSGERMGGTCCVVSVRNHLTTEVSNNYIYTFAYAPEIRCVFSTSTEKLNENCTYYNNE
jgi:hypothetical protein